jgi:hypothetical protein
LGAEGGGGGGGAGGGGSGGGDGALAGGTSSSSASASDAAPPSPSPLQQVVAFLKANYFLLGMLGCIAAASVAPWLGCTGGPLRPELTVNQFAIRGMFLISVGLPRRPDENPEKHEHCSLLNVTPAWLIHRRDLYHSMKRSISTVEELLQSAKVDLYAPGLNLPLAKLKEAVTNVKANALIQAFIFGVGGLAVAFVIGPALKATGILTPRLVDGLVVGRVRV